MTRPKVDPDKRQRIAQACDSCKRRKQKCNGLKPCEKCSKRTLECTYGAAETGPAEDGPSPKRRMLEPVPDGLSMGTNNIHVHSPAITQAHWSPGIMKHDLNGVQYSGQTPNAVGDTPGAGPFPDKDDKQKKSPNDADGIPGIGSGASTSDGHEEEAERFSHTRMLLDPKGRLLYIGDSASLSFLQLIRLVVDSVVGSSPFTNDPRRYKIVENPLTLPENLRRTHLLPDRQTANILVASYFTNVNGLIEVFQRRSFLMTLEACYTDPLNADASWLCMLYLVFAIGLVMATPIPGTPEDAIIQKLRNERFDRAEIFYSDAKQLADPSSGFEDAGFWSIQALTLMSVYTLAISKRNAAYAYYGMAVRSAFALGLHREESMSLFSTSEQSTRRNLWRSLFVLDRFLAASLGRPTAIRESDCSDDILQLGEKAPFPQAPFPTEANASFSSSGALGLKASVSSCQMIGMILEKVYSKRKISTKLAQEIATLCKGWPKSLDPSLQHRQASPVDPAQGIAILHVNLLNCHSVILLTRPFFLFLMNKFHNEQNDPMRKTDRNTSRMERFAEACVTASTHSISLVQTALEGRYLPHRNPFVLYFLFAAALVVLANDFSALVNNPKANSSIMSAINIMNYLAQQDPQGSRLHFILTAFRDVVIRQQVARSQHMSANQTPQSFMNAAVPVTDDNDPMGSLFSNNGPFSPTATAGLPKVESGISRPSSDPKITSPLAPHASLRRTSSHPNAGLSGTNGDYLGSRNNSIDHHLDLSRVNSYPNSVEGNDSLGDAEIDFEALWSGWNSTGFTPSGMPSASMLGGQSGLSGIIDVPGLNDSNVPLFGMNTSEFGGN
ncbi:uncharacterized protein LY89DRAFT_428223 [Mollisia scopiformis]|uniref:Zn(2)-C6 fungal-type domain-containing protein n=1 Tax=Mollisia scopiformis TaxID=149040 RepID=A0A194XLV6_MOLSC|nr:uncharacterized protein LY89DRAFT_428223 [Mollisia scopiformis]KUJ21163.1 hypothetical protein LY89DRAFT_428223 [Mollisia scopiformis]